MVQAQDDGENSGRGVTEEKGQKPKNKHDGKASVLVDLSVSSSYGILATCIPRCAVLLRCCHITMR